MWIDLSPLRDNPDYRRLFWGQFVSYVGSMMTYVAIPYQVYELTRSSWLVGLIGVVQLVPVLVLGLVGGSFADAFNRRRLLITCESGMGLAALGLVANAASPAPSVPLIFVLAGLLQALNTFHRPAMEALTQKLVDPERYAAIGALGALRYGFGAVAGPALGGLLMTWGGAQITYALDALSFFFAAWMAWRVSASGEVEPGEEGHVERILVGLRFAMERPQLIGTYLVDIIAMVFAFPVALFPEMGDRWGGASASGVLLSAMSAGGVVLTLMSGWTGAVKRRGAAVVLAAGVWGVAIIGVGLADNLWVAALFLAVAGAADMISGLFRQVIWNESIPNEMRGRMAGVEMISYLSGPLLGNTRAGWMATTWSVSTSLVWGGVLCTVGVALCGVLLTGFWRYVPQLASAPAPAGEGEGGGG